MTADKGFKKLVRARMRQTGQPYAAVRQSLRPPKGREPKMATQQELYEQMAAMKAAACELLAPIAEEHGKPLDPGLVSAMMFDRDNGHWYVDLYTMCPGLVIGRRGATADALRDKLVEITGDDRLHINLVDFGQMHEERRAARRAAR